MPDPEANALIERLRRSNRRWKALALGSAAALAVLLLSCAGAAVSLGALAAAERDRAVRSEQEARERAEEARRQAERAEAARRRAEEALRAEEEARRAAEKAKGAVPPP